MRKVSIRRAKSNLSRLVEAIETGLEQEIIIARNGRPAAKLVPLCAPAASRAHPRIGIAQGKFAVPDPIARHDEKIASLFQGSKSQSDECTLL
jgi:prevent-host-death family protein